MLDARRGVVSCCCDLYFKTEPARMSFRPRRRLKPLCKPAGVVDCEPRIVVVEVGVHVDALGEPGGEAFGHPEQALFAVLASVGVLESVRTVKPDVSPVGRQLPGMVGHKVMDAQGGANNPNSLGRGCPFPAGTAGYVFAPREVTGQRVRARAQSFSDHYSQASMFWESMSPVEQGHIVGAFSFELGKRRHEEVKDRMLANLANVSSGLVERVAAKLGKPAPRSGPTGEVIVSASLAAMGPPHWPKTRMSRSTLPRLTVIPRPSPPGAPGDKSSMPPA